MTLRCNKLSLKKLGVLMIILVTAYGITSCTGNSSATSSSLDSEQDREWSLSYFADIPVWIAVNRVATDALVHNRKIIMLLGEEHFNEADLNKVFVSMAAQYDQPEHLIITALSNRDMVRRELKKKESTTNYTLPEGASSQQSDEEPEQKIKYVRAYYLRLHDEERFGYTLDPERGDYRTIYLKGSGIR